MDRLRAALLIAALGIASSAQALEVKHWFPENPTLEFFPGKEIQTVFGIKNTGPDALNVSFAAASLASPYDASINVYNFTTQFLNHVPLASGDELSVDYPLFFPAQLPARDFVLKLLLLTSVGNDYQQTVVFNQTVNVVEVTGWIDFQLIGLYVIFLGFLGLIGYSGVEWARSKGYIKKSKKKASKIVAGPADRSDYLKGTAGHEFLKKRAARKN